MNRQMTVSAGRMVVAAMAASIVGAPCEARGSELGGTPPQQQREPATQAPPEGPRRPEGPATRGGSSRRGDPRSDERAQFRAERTDRQTRVLALGPSGVLELRTFNGDISVISGTGSEVRVETIRRSRGRTDADVNTGLDQVTTSITHEGDRATVGVKQPPARRTPYWVTVSFVVTAPAGTRIAASSVLGNVSIRNISGEIDAQVTSGDITISGARRIASAKSISGNVTLSDIATDESVNAGTMSGDVILDRVKARRIEVEVTGGNVRANDVECRNAAIGSLGGSVDFAGRLISGGRYQLRAHSGNLRITVLGTVGFELVANSFSGMIRPAPGLSLQSISRVRGSLKGTVGDASAQIQASTFSGDIEIGRR